MKKLAKKNVQNMSQVEGDFNFRQVIKRDYTRLNLNENAFGPSPKVEKALNDLNYKDLAFYPDPYVSKLRQALADYHGIDSNRFVFTNGLDEMILLLPRTYIEPGDELVFPEPSFYEYRNQALVDGAEVIGVALLSSGYVDWEAMKNSLSPKTKLVYICNPNNPTGVYEDLADIRDFLDYSKDYNLLVLIDEAYIEFSDLHEEGSAVKLLDEFDHFAVMRTFSKAYGLANIRLGYTILPEELAVLGEATRTAFNISSYKENVGLAALEDQAYLEEIRLTTAEERANWIDVLSDLSLDYYPSQTNFIMFHLDQAQDFIDIAYEMGYIINTHTNPDWIRMSIPNPSDGDDLREALIDFCEDNQ